MHDDTELSARRVVVRAALLLLPVIAVTAATPWAIGRLRGGAAAPTAEERRDRPPTDAEIREARRSDEKAAERERKNWAGSTSIAPRDAEVDASGERVRWFQGFGLSVESRPEGAMVVVNGQELGETPLTASVQCSPGDAVEIEVRKPGLRPVRRSTRCRDDRLVELSVRLE